MMLLYGCDDSQVAPKKGTIEAASDSSKVSEGDRKFWTLAPAKKEDVSNALSACLSIIRDNKNADSFLRESGWTHKPFPKWAEEKGDKTAAKRAYEKKDQSSLIAFGSDDSGPVCSVLSATNHQMLVDVVDGLAGSFSKGMEMMPHGPWWTVDGVRIDNDYANLHVFRPEVFNPDDFFQSKLSDIRIYKCKEHC